MTERFIAEPTPPEEPKNFWYGKDFVTTEEEEIVSGLTEISVLPLHDESLPKNGKISNLSIATRSRFAQWGLEVVQKGVESIAMNEEETQRIFYRTPAMIKVKSHTGNTLHIPPSTPIFSLYSRGPSIVGEELADIVGPGKDIDIEGKQGKAWKFVYKTPYTSRPEDVMGIAVQIRNDKRWYIPQRDQELDLAELATADRNYRTVLDRLYDPVPRNQPVDIWFGELPGLKLSHRVAVEIAKPIAPSLNIVADVEEMERQRMYPNGRHIGARLLHPGSGLNNSDVWPIRVEIDTRGSVQKPGCVIFRPMWSEKTV